LKGKTVTPELIAKAADAAFEQVEPEDDPVYGSAEYKRELVRTLTERSLLTAFSRARNSE
jgi:CO/xanthine dehydrogenase FAD-binding subunit